MSQRWHYDRSLPLLPVRISGVTLVELLCALAVAGLVVAVLFAAYFAVIRTAGRTVGSRAAGAASDALDTLARDFMCAIIPDNLTNPPLMLTAATGTVSGSHCVFYTAMPWSPGHGPKAYAVHEVRVGMWAGARSDEYMIERISRPVLLPASTNIVRETWASVRTMTIEVYDGQDWTGHWENADLPQAVRMRVAYGTAPLATMVMEVPVPAGIPFGPTNGAGRQTDTKHTKGL